MRQLVVLDVAYAPIVADRLNAILGSAKQKVEASGLPTSFIDDIDRCIESVRNERIADGLL